MVHNDEELRQKRDAVVILLCGLPGSGKSTLAKSIIGNYCASKTTHKNTDKPNDDASLFTVNDTFTKPNGQNNLEHPLITLIDYDEITFELAKALRADEPTNISLSIEHTDTFTILDRGMIQCNDEGDKKVPQQYSDRYEASTSENNRNNGFNKEDLKAWRMTRKEALEKLGRELNAVSTSSDHKSKIIMMDDNFHLRSMRRDVFKICQHFLRKNNGSDDEDSLNEKGTRTSISIGLVILHVDIPLEQCILNNANRKNTNQFIPPRIIQDMYSVFEKPNGKIHKFESCTIRLSHQLKYDHDTNGEKVGNDIDNFCQLLSNEIEKSLSEQFQIRESIIPTQKSLEQLKLEREQTMKSEIHRADLLLRALVGAVCKKDKKFAKRANMARKLVMNQYKLSFIDTNITALGEDLVGAMTIGSDMVVNEFKSKTLNESGCTAEQEAELKLLIEETHKHFMTNKARDKDST